MTIENILAKLSIDYAKDIKLNLGKILEVDPETNLTLKQIYLIALSCAYTTKNKELSQALNNLVSTELNATDIAAAKGAAAIMGMNNVYYRFVHLVSDNEYRNLPAKLRMNILSSAGGVEQVDFELMSLAISSINGCGLCIDAHVNKLEKNGVDKLDIQQSIRIGAVINAVADVLAIES